MTSSLKHLEWALATNPHDLKDLLFDAYKNNLKYLRHLNKLIYFLRKHGCRNIQGKLNDVPNLNKFQSIVSELEIAQALIRRGKSVELLPDTYMGMTSPPDLLVSDKKIEAYIEVKRITDDSTFDLIINFLRRFLNKNNYPYIVNVELNEMMSIPAITWQERQHKEKVIRKAFQEFEAKIKILNSKSLPAEIETIAGKFEIKRSIKGKGFPGFIRTSFVKISEERQIEKIRRDVIVKAKKRNKWSNEHRSKIFIIALDFEELFYNKDYLEIALIGNTEKYIPPLKVPNKPLTKEILHAIKLGWEPFLREKYIIPSKQICLNNKRKGIYLTEPIAKNISGVLGKFGQELHFIPNPFAYDEINDPNLLKFI